VAQKLHRDYNFDYANLQVLLGGWSAWQNLSSQDPNGYPIETSSGGAAPGGNINPGQAVTMTVVLAPDPNSTPAP
jgi:hypothetical protein